MYRTSKKPLAKRTGLSAIVALGALVTGVGVAGATTHTITTHSVVATPHSRTEHHGPVAMRGLGGKIIALSATSVTIQNLSGASNSYTIDASTTVTLDDRTVTLANLAVGELVWIETNSANATSARSIDIALAHVGGQVESVSANTITVSDRDGFYRTLSVSSATTYAKGAQSATLNEVSVGSFIMAVGTVDANHTTLDTSSIRIGRPHSVAGAPAGPMDMDPRGRAASTDAMAGAKP